MNSLLVVVDMQNDFISGALGSEQARAIVPAVTEKIRTWPGDLAYTLDTHDDRYAQTQEGRLLPVPHCKKDTFGWQLQSDVRAALSRKGKEIAVFEKPSFGSAAFGEFLRKQPYDRICFIGVCTDICVISNALLAKAFLPEAAVSVDAACCAGVTPESHKTALNAMKACQIQIENEN